MCFALAKIEELTIASDIVKSLTILHAIRWIAQSRNTVKHVMKRKSFRKAGILNHNFQVVCQVVHTWDKFQRSGGDERVLEDDVEFIY